jgi:protein-S-isoprenylcysteine O-methyltransferase Ste14
LNVKGSVRTAVAGTAAFLFIAPGTFVGFVPWWISRWRFQPPFMGFAPFRVFGAVLLAAGVAVILDSFARFALEGMGTPAPVLPPKRLVVTGFYRFVRNPMYVAVVSAILGQGLLLGDIRILVYAAVAWLAVHLFVIIYEEPTLRKTFGVAYEDYRARVPRWLPRFP